MDADSALRRRSSSRRASRSGSGRTRPNFDRSHHGRRNFAETDQIRRDRRYKPKGLVVAPSQTFCTAQVTEDRRGTHKWCAVLFYVAGARHQASVRRARSARLSRSLGVGLGRELSRKVPKPACLIASRQYSSQSRCVVRTISHRYQIGRTPIWLRDTLG